MVAHNVMPSAQKQFKNLRFHFIIFFHYFCGTEHDTLLQQSNTMLAMISPVMHFNVITCASEGY